ncbi:hypothetical protein CNEO2_990003 [Clostridium neonatale]|nr:hypothetical protein CNEO2_990003 [Clostridium neonatale]
MQDSSLKIKYGSKETILNLGAFWLRRGGKWFAKRVEGSMCPR